MIKMKYTEYNKFNYLALYINNTIQELINKNIKINNEKIIALIKNQYIDYYEKTKNEYKDFINKCFNIIGEKQLLFDCCTTDVYDLLHLLCFIYPILTEELEFKIIKKIQNKKLFNLYNIELILENYDFKYEKNKQYVEKLQTILKLK